jgi:hypothetical protein
MSYKLTLWGLRILALLALGFLSYLAFYTNPYQDQNLETQELLNIVLFQIGLFIFLSAVFSIFLFWIRRRKAGEQRTGSLCVLLNVSVRQGILLALGISILLILQSFRILTWWDSLLAIGAVFLIELYFLTR